MKRNKILGLVGVILFLHQIVLAQTMPSPDAVALAKYSDIPVNLSTGIPNISFPLYELKSGGVSVPISVSYHASGIKLGDVASSVGLGWSLNAGGRITKVIRGKEDNGTIVEVDDMLKEATNWKSVEEKFEEYPEIYKNLKALRDGDTESDVYYLSFLGYSTTFFIKPDGGILYKNNDKLIIEKKDHEWWVTTTEGNVFIFGSNADRDGYEEKTFGTAVTDRTIWPAGCEGEEFCCLDREDHDCVEANTTRVANAIEEYVSSWMLRSIITNTGEQIDFSYNLFESKTYQHSYGSEFHKAVAANTENRNHFSNPEGENLEDFYDIFVLGAVVEHEISTVTDINNKSLHIQKITSQSGGVIEFEYSDDDRMDVRQPSEEHPSKRLVGFKVKTKEDGDCMDHVVFDNDSYFYSSDVPEDPESIGHYHRWLQLRGIYRASCADPTSRLSIATFSYNSQRFPSNTRLKPDKFGYYSTSINGWSYSIDGDYKILLHRSETSGAIDRIEFEKIFDDFSDISGFLRQSRLADAKSFILESIHYPTGASRNFGYEMGDMGLRVEWISHKLNETDSLTTRYYYERHYEEDDDHEDFERIPESTSAWGQWPSTRDNFYVTFDEIDCYNENCKSTPVTFDGGRQEILVVESCDLETRRYPKRVVFDVVLHLNKTQSTLDKTYPLRYRQVEVEKVSRSGNTLGSTIHYFSGEYEGEHPTLNWLFFTPNTRRFRSDIEGLN